MNNVKLYKSLRAAASESFREATAEELRVLVVLMESEGEDLTYKEIASRASVSAARARSATELWRAEGVLSDTPRGGQRAFSPIRPEAATPIMLIIMKAT